MNIVDGGEGGFDGADAQGVNYFIIACYKDSIIEGMVAMREIGHPNIPGGLLAFHGINGWAQKVVIKTVFYKVAIKRFIVEFLQFGMSDFVPFSFFGGIKEEVAIGAVCIIFPQFITPFFIRAVLFEPK